MIRAIENYKFNTPKYNNNQSFTGNINNLRYKGNILMDGRKKFSGLLSFEQSDGTLLITEYLKGLLSKAEKFTSDTIKLMKFTNKGEEVINVPVKRKRIYEKKYNRSQMNGELMSVEKDGKQTYKKAYSFAPYAEIPISKIINDGQIITGYDLNNRKISVMMPYKYIKADFFYQNGISAELRTKIYPEAMIKMIHDYQSGVPLPDKPALLARVDRKIIRDPNSDIDAIHTTIYNEKEQPQRIVGRTKYGEFSYEINFEYNENGDITKRITTGVNGNKVEDFFEDNLPVHSKATRKDGIVVQSVKRKFNSKTRYRTEEVNYNYHPELGIKKIIKEYEHDNIHFVDEILKFNDGKKYTGKMRFNIATDELISAEYFGPNNKPITASEFREINLKFI